MKVYVVIWYGEHDPDEGPDCWWNMNEYSIEGVFKTRESAEKFISEREETDEEACWYYETELKIKEFELID